MPTLENRIPPPLVMAMIAVAMWLASREAPALTMPDAIRQIVSAALFSLAGLFAVAADNGRQLAHRVKDDPNLKSKASLQRFP